MDAFKATFALNTTIVEGPIERHKSWLASRETGDGLTGKFIRGSLDRTESSVPKWSRQRRARADLGEASRRDKAVRSWSIDHSLCPEMQLMFYNHINPQLLIHFSDRVVRGDWNLVLHVTSTPYPKLLVVLHTWYLVQQYLINLNSHMFRRPPQEELIWTKNFHFLYQKL